MSDLPKIDEMTAPAEGVVAMNGPNGDRVRLPNGQWAPSGKAKARATMEKRDRMTRERGRNKPTMTPIGPGASTRPRGGGSRGSGSRGSSSAPRTVQEKKDRANGVSPGGGPGGGRGATGWATATPKPESTRAAETAPKNPMPPQRGGNRSPTMKAPEATPAAPMSATAASNATEATALPTERAHVTVNLSSVRATVSRQSSTAASGSTAAKPTVLKR